ncbi:MAG: Tol-Pal system beta propeller repeat protein TolB [Deltaproteobacteria bacterium]|nr:Tol-Pal system beta propeller repeat protein TolB [Deltaproteobacteria bacterium]MDL1960694.1 Tol-Pal system beta propeller repeat protein TolB [Deltaproteobacteria bacterium]
MNDKNIYKKTFGWIFFLLFLISGPSLVEARLYIDITSPYLQKIPIAVPYLEVTPSTFENDLLGRKISKVLSDDLIFHGFFSVLDPASYGGRLGADWSKFRLDYLVKGSIEKKSNSVIAELRLFDMSTGAMIQGRRYNGQVKDYRMIAHRFCDLIVMAITGKHGVSLSKITFVAKKDRLKEVYSSDFDGFNIRRETFDKGITVSPRYSPNGRYIAYTSYRTGRPYLYVKDTKTGKIYKLTAYSGLNIAPAWHPDNHCLAVTLSKDGNPDIYIIDLKGRIKTRLTRGPGINVSPTWSPDGKRLAFVSDRSGGPQIYVVDIRTKSARRITYSGAYNTDPQWSPHGDRIVYTGRTEGCFQVFSISPEGGDPIQLTYSGNNENPSWSPDSRQIIFSSTRMGPEKALFVMYANGRGQRMLLRYSNGVEIANWGPNIF